MGIGDEWCTGKLEEAERLRSGRSNMGWSGGDSSKLRAGEGLIRRGLEGVRGLC